MQLILLGLFFTTSTLASILPENNRVISLSDKNEGLTQAQYEEAIAKADAVYRPILDKLGKKLTINKLWEDPRVNAGTTKKGHEIIINLYGGYPRHPLATQDAFLLVVCHELGHHLGGAPRKIFDSGEIGWPSTEGQADYFATLKCLRKIFRKDNNIAIASQMQIPSLIKEKCNNPFKEEWEKALCVRTSMAGITVSHISADIRNTPLPVIEAPDQSIVTETFDGHPEPQCRLDTYFQGSICEVSSVKPVSATDEAEGTCHQKNLHADGLRPLCWFKPKIIE